MTEAVGQSAPTALTEEKPAVLILGGLGELFAVPKPSEQLVLTPMDDVIQAISDAFLLFTSTRTSSHPNLLTGQIYASRRKQRACVDSTRRRILSSDKFEDLETLPRIFDRSSGKQFDYVFNCGGETRYSQDDEVYRLRSLNLSVAAGKEAAKRGVKAFIEVSTGMVYKPDPSPRKETDKTKPWLKMANWKLTAEEELAKIEGLNLVVLRLAHVYGDYSSKFVATALSLARVYQYLGKEMKWLWDKDLRVNTVHIDDATRAIWKAAEWSNQGRKGWNSSWGKVALFNIVDHGNTSQGTMSQIIADIFSIPTGFQGSIISNFARLNLDSVVDDVNDEILGPWADLLAAANITRPGPLSPFMEKELLKDTDLSLNGARFEEVAGFKYEKERITQGEIQGMIDSYKRMNWWP
ncbi:MAG: hypothetical protein M1812_003190 [Candelaria pacifica]|nr:MAG: hypothetical protein M1812_003190 [Candelaria pacifica]